MDLGVTGRKNPKGRNKMINPDGGVRPSTQEHKMKNKYTRKNKYKNYGIDYEDSF